jgi:hypothetical protein
MISYSPATAACVCHLQRAFLDSQRGERLGHTTVSITLDTCSHTIPAMEQEAAALSAGLVFAAH